MKAAFLVATAVSLASMASAAVSPVFIGCYYPGLADNLIANLISGVANTLTFTTAASCANGCGTLEYEYSIYNPGITLLGTTLIPSCYCAPAAAINPTALKENYIVTAQNSQGSACQNPVLSVGVILPIYQVQRTQYDVATSSQVTQQGCYTSATLTGGSSSTITNPDTCFSTCLNWKYMSITPVGTGGTYTCTCGTAETLGTSANCAVNRPVVYTNSDGTASLAARRRRALEIAARMQAQQKVCPGSLKSCFTATPSLSEGIAFECVDTKSELESCGGCVRGEYTNDFVLGQTIATSGEDCTAIEGVAFGAVSCVKGRCVASQCSSGYRLVNGSCEPDASFKVQARANAKAN